MNNEYNGWTNYETWNFNLWLDNDFQDYDLINKLAINCINGNCSAFNELTASGAFCANNEENIIFYLSQKLEEFAEEQIESLNVPACFVSDLINSGVKAINFYEIAEHIFDNVKNEFKSKLID